MTLSNTFFDRCELATGETTTYTRRVQTSAVTQSSYEAFKTDNYKDIYIYISPAKIITDLSAIVKGRNKGNGGRENRKKLHFLLLYDDDIR